MLRLALALSLALAVIAAALVLLVFRPLSDRAWAEAEAMLRAHVLLMQGGLGADIETGEASAMQARTLALSKSLDIRITLIRADGTVLADSNGNPEKMDNLGTRSEVLAALTEEFATCRRFSPTLGVDSLFVARAIRRDGQLTGWIRASVTTERVTAGMRAIEWGVVAAIALAALAAWLVGAQWSDFRTRRRLAEQE